MRDAEFRRKAKVKDKRKRTSRVDAWRSQDSQMDEYVPKSARMTDAQAPRHKAIAEQIESFDLAL